MNNHIILITSNKCALRNIIYFLNILYEKAPPMEESLCTRVSYIF